MDPRASVLHRGFDDVRAEALEGLVHRDGRKLDGQAAGKHDPALDGFDEVRDGAVARVVAAAGVGDTDDRPYGNSGCVHVDEQEGDPFLFLDIGVGTDQTEHHVRPMRK